jgi:hypothetical protein
MDRFGFLIAFLERQKLLEILYQTYPDPSKIIVDQKVLEVKLLENKSCVVTKDGSMYMGDLLVGADGVHSRIRSEMWRLADTKDPGLITHREKTGMSPRHLCPFNNQAAMAERNCTTGMRTEYACIFGISSPINGWNAGEQVNALYDGLTIVTIHGQGGRIFWFIIKKLERKYTYPDRPTFPPETAEGIADNLKSFRIWRNVYVKDLWDQREVASMTPLEENVFRIWHYDRMTLIGDSAHKVCLHLSPIFIAANIN